MSADNTLSSLNATMKYVVDEKIKHLAPSHAILQNMISLKEEDKLGRKALIPVCLTNEHGITYGDGTAFALNDAIAAVYDELEVDVQPISLRTRVSLSAANRWKSSKKAMVNNVALRAGTMKKSLQSVAEIEALYGQSGIGTIHAVSDSSGTNTLTFTDASWAPGIWAGSVGMKLDVYNGASKRNSNAVAVISAVNFDNKTITVTGNSTDTASFAQNDVVYPAGAYGKGMVGIYKQLSNSGTIFGIDASLHDTFRANTHAVGGQLTMAEVLKGQAKAISRGGLEDDVILLVAPVTFEKLNSDLAALSVLDPSDKEGQNGFNKIKYKSQAGFIEVIAHPYVKEGEAMSFPKSALRKTGSSDIDFMKDEAGGFWRSLDVAGYAGYQCTSFLEYTFVICEPSKCVLYSQITN